MGEESCPLPEHPALVEAARALRDTGHWAWIVDDRWRLVYVTDELRLTFGAGLELAPFALGEHLFGPNAKRLSEGYRFGANTTELTRLIFAGVGGWMLTDTPGTRDELCDLVDRSLRDLVEDLTPANPAAVGFIASGIGLSGARDIPAVGIRIDDGAGRLAGTMLVSKPGPGMTTLAAEADPPAPTRPAP